MPGFGDSPTRSKTTVFDGIAIAVPFLAEEIYRRKLKL